MNTQSGIRQSVQLIKQKTANSRYRRIVSVVFFLTAGLSFSQPTYAGLCSLGSPQTKVLHEYWKVPNLKQSDYGGPNDCGPLAAAQILTYFDAKGTPGIINNPLQNNGVNVQMEDLIQDLYSELPYSGSLGTWDFAQLIGFGDIGEEVKDVAQSRTANANNWNTAESGSVEFSNIGWHMDHDNPVMLLIYWPGNEMYGGIYGGTDVTYHWMPIIARYYRKWGYKAYYTFYYCWDYLAWDARYVAVRTGWVKHPSNDYTWLDYNELANWYSVRIDNKVVF